MALRTSRLNGSQDEPFTLEVQGEVTPASVLLWHLCRLPGLKVIAKKSYALTDDFEAYFSYKGRLFIMQTPFVRVWISLIGQPPDNELFAEIESRVQSFSYLTYLLAPLAIVRFFALPRNPPDALLEAQGVSAQKWWGKNENAL